MRGEVILEWWNKIGKKMTRSSLLIMLHCEQNTGYAIETLEKVFVLAAKQAGYTDGNIHWSYRKVVSTADARTIECDYRNPNADFHAFLTKNRIDTVLAFDLNYPAPVIGLLKRAGVNRIVSYWGAAISSINRGPKLWLKQIEWLLRSNKPDFFIFESEAMRETATKGRGVPWKKTRVIPLGVDTSKFYPMVENSAYAHQVFGIPANRKIIFYSGHMEERKGIRTVINCAIDLIDNRGCEDIHFLLCGNKKDEALPYLQMLGATKAKSYVTFGGYRDDIAKLMRSSFIGVIASTGWDSFTLSSVEMMASGLPLIVSKLQGLAETIEDGVNGLYIEPGNHHDLVEKIEYMMKHSSTASKFSLASRERALTKFSAAKQAKEIALLL